MPSRSADGEAEAKRWRIGVDLGTVLGGDAASSYSAPIRLTWVTAGYGWFTVVAPILVAAPVYFAGDLSASAD